MVSGHVKTQLIAHDKEVSYFLMLLFLSQRMPLSNDGPNCSFCQ